MHHRTNQFIGFESLTATCIAVKKKKSFWYKYITKLNGERRAPFQFPS